LLQRLVIAFVSVCGLLLMTSLGVVWTLIRRWRRLKHGRAHGDEMSSSGSGVQLDDLVKVLCYTGRRRRRQGAKPARPAHADAAVNGQLVPVLPDHSELVQLVLGSQLVGGGVMQENERYSSAADINARGQSMFSSFTTYLRSCRPNYQFNNNNNRNSNSILWQRLTHFVMLIGFYPRGTSDARVLSINQSINQSINH